MSRYQGLDPALKTSVFARDNWRCRWCGIQRAWYGFDAHHIQYRRHSSDDRLDNLITLCRKCHNYIHDSYQIPKITAQAILSDLVESAGVTGRMLLRRYETQQKRLDGGIPGPSGLGPGRLL